MRFLHNDELEQAALELQISRDLFKFEGYMLFALL